MSEFITPPRDLHVEYRGEQARIPIVTSFVDMRELVETRLIPGLRELRAAVPDEYVEYAGYAMAHYEPREDRLINQFPEEAEALAGALILAEVDVNRMTPARTQDYWITTGECLDTLTRPAFDWRTYNRRGVWRQSSFTERIGFVIGPVVRTNNINGVHVPQPTDQYHEINFRSEFAAFVPGDTFLSWLQIKYPALQEGFAVDKRSMGKLFTEEFGLRAEDSTYDAWYRELRMRQLGAQGLEPYEKD